MAQVSQSSRKLKLVSDGTPFGTQLLDNETGVDYIKALGHVVSVRWEMTQDTSLLTLELFGVTAEFDFDKERIALELKPLP